MVATPVCRQMEDFGGLNHEFFYRQAIYIGHQVTSDLYNTIEVGKESGGLLTEMF